MPTQIAATPLLTGEDALRVIEDSKILPTEKTLRAFEAFRKEFEGMRVRYNNRVNK